MWPPRCRAGPVKRLHVTNETATRWLPGILDAERAEIRLNQRSRRPRSTPANNCPKPRARGGTYLFRLLRAILAGGASPGVGVDNGSRTRTGSPPPDFKSCVSTRSTTSATVPQAEGDGARNRAERGGQRFKSFSGHRIVYAKRDCMAVLLQSERSLPRGSDQSASRAGHR